MSDIDQLLSVSQAVIRGVDGNLKNAERLSSDDFYQLADALKDTALTLNSIGRIKELRSLNALLSNN